MMRYEVRQLNPFRQRLLLLVVVLLLLALAGASYWLGQRYAGRDFAGLEARVAVLSQQRSQLQRDKQALLNSQAALKRGSELDNAAMQAAKDELARLQGDMVELKEELVFYQSLLSPQERAPGLHIQSFVLDELQAGVYRYTLVLTQVHQGGKMTKGQVALGWPEMLQSGTEESPGTAWQIDQILDRQNFAFKFFQRIEGQIRLPAGAVPGQQIMIQVEPTGRRLKSIEQLYNWAALLGGTE